MELRSIISEKVSVQNYLEILQRIAFRSVSGLTPEERLSNLVKTVSQDLFWDVCSIYLLDKEKEELILTATYGLATNSIGRVRIAVSEGIVGSVVSSGKSMFLKNASSDPRFIYIPETKEEKYSSLAAIPFSREGAISGVLTVQTIKPHSFSSVDRQFLNILANQIGLSVDVPLSLKTIGQSKTSVLVGIPASPGIALGLVYLVSPISRHVELLSRGFACAEAEKKIFEDARLKAIEEMNELVLKLDKAGSPVAQIFVAHEAMLQDRNFVSKVSRYIEERHESAPRAVAFLMDEYINKFNSFGDKFIREKAQDMRELRDTLFRFMDSEEHSSQPQGSEEENLIVATKNMSAQDAIRLDRNKILAFVSETGTDFSHASILARALHMPAVAGINGLMDMVKPEDRLLVDGYNGFLFINPDEKIVKEYVDRNVDIEKKMGAIRDILSQETTEDLLCGNVTIDANIGLPLEIDDALAEGISSVGLLRTEFFYMSQKSWPDEELQEKFYTRVLTSFSSGEVTIRLLDIGADKVLSYMPERRSDNYHFGIRSVRFLLSNREILRSQLRAIHVSAKESGTKPKILLPMVTNVWEIKTVREIFLEETNGEEYLIGSMVENPAAIFQIKEIVEASDFISIGTNDLAQYLLAVDRNDSRVKHLYHNLHPALVRALHHLIDLVRGDFSVCGEMAGDPLSVLALLSFGYRRFSLSPSRAMEIRYLVRQIPEGILEDLKPRILELDDPEKSEELLGGVLKEYAPLLV